MPIDSVILHSLQDRHTGKLGSVIRNKGGGHATFGNDPV